MDIEDSYVVRIYRRGRPNAEASARDGHPRLIGVVESPATGQRQAFHDIEELWTVLAQTGSPVLGGKRKKSTPIEM